MKKASKLFCIILLGCLIPPFAEAQLALVSPPHGAETSSPPTFQWSAGSYHYFKFYCAFNYTGYGYIPVLLGWYPITSLTVSQGWW